MADFACSGGESPEAEVDSRTESFRAAPLAAPAYSLPDMPEEPQGAHFDPALHLQLEPPALVKDLNFQDVPFPYSPEQAAVRGQLAYTQPFRVLSEAGVAAAREAIFENQELLKVSNSRIPHCLRGLGCVSNFHREMAHCSQLLSLFQALARDELSPHTFQKNMSHTNIGAPQATADRGTDTDTGTYTAEGDGEVVPVDKWHTDSVDYVVVIILSDLTDMRGGDLQVLQLPDSSSSSTGVFASLKRSGIPPELVETVNYCGPGFAIFMQGSKILHTVRGVLAAREPRVSLVNSYMSTRVFGRDTTLYSTYVHGDSKAVVDMEFARHKAWRVAGQLSFIRDSPKFIADTALLSRVLRGAAAELLSAAEELEGTHEEENTNFI